MTIWTAILTALVAALGVGHVFLNKPSRVLGTVQLIALAILAALTVVQDSRTEKALTGDVTNPPFYDVIEIGPDGNLTRGWQAIVNPSDYPARGVSYSLRTVDGANPNFSSSNAIGDVPADGTIRVNPYGGFNGVGADGAIDLEIQIRTLAGSYHEQLLLRRLGDHEWARALRIFDEAKERLTVDPLVDDSFPTTGDERIDWPPLAD